MNYHNYHCHTLFSDGHTEAEEFVVEAISQNMAVIGFSEHAPIPYDTCWCMNETELPAYYKRIHELKKKYAQQIEILLSLEIDYIPGFLTDCAPLKEQLELDYIVGSIHMVANNTKDKLWFVDGPVEDYKDGINELFNGSPQKAVTAYYQQTIEMLEAWKPDIVGHIDKVKMNNDGLFSVEDKWYKDLTHATIDAVKKAGSIVEVNTRGIYTKSSADLYPSNEILAYCYEKKVPVTLSSDAHHPSQQLLYFDESREILKQIGYKEIYILSKGKWEAIQL